jgi:hypothetical protein
MVRNIVIIHLKDGTTPEAVQALKTALEAMRVPGLLQMTVGVDLRLRDGNADVGIVSDLADEAAYRVYDADEEHNRIRRELVAPIAASVDRCQFLVA